MWFLPFFLAKAFAAFLSNCLTLRKDVDVSLIVRRRIGRQKRIYAYIQASNFLSNLYAISDVIAKVASEFELFTKLSNQRAAQFGMALK